jgi:hypothetical protein
MTDPTAQIVSDVLKSYPALSLIWIVLAWVAKCVGDKLYPDLKALAQDALLWYRTQLGQYMERDRLVIIENAKNRVLVASK